MSENLDILDLKTALKAVSGNKQLADDLLGMFIKELPNYKQTIQNHIQSGNREDLKQVIHKIHGGLRYLGAPALMSLISQMDEVLFDLSDNELKDGIEKIYFEIDRVLETGGYSELKNTISRAHKAL